MSHVHRLRLSDRIFFVTVNQHLRLPAFADAEYRLIASAIKESRRKLKFLFVGYVLMPDHWHALIWPAYPLTISRVVQDIKWISSRAVNRARQTTGALWQHQFWDRFVRHAQEFRERLDYMHLNPVRKGLVRQPSDWRWSSYNNFALGKEQVSRCPLQIDYVHLPQSYQVEKSPRHKRRVVAARLSHKKSLRSWSCFKRSRNVKEKTGLIRIRQKLWVGWGQRPRFC